MDLAINGLLRAAAILGCALIAGCGGGGGGAPDKLLYVSDLFTSRNLKGSRAAVVDP